MAKVPCLVLLLSSVVSLAGCALGSQDSAPVDSKSPTAELSEPISGGAPLGGGHGAVLIYTDNAFNCTGVAITPYAVLTAAHCFDGVLGNGLYGAVYTQVYYTKDGYSYQCVNGSGGDTCDGSNYAWVSRQSGANRNQVFSDPTGNDFAILLLPESMGDFVDLAGLTTNAFVTQGFNFYGKGNTNDTSGDGWMRTFTDSLDWVGSRHVFFNAGTYRLCKGDSGGPLLWANWAVIGVATDVEASSGHTCAKSGGKQRAKRITRSDVDFINGELAWWDPYDPQCQEVGTDEFWCWY